MDSEWSKEVHPEEYVNHAFKCKLIQDVVALLWNQNIVAVHKPMKLIWTVNIFNHEVHIRYNNSLRNHIIIRLMQFF